MRIKGNRWALRAAIVAGTVITATGAIAFWASHAFQAVGEADRRPGGSGGATEVTTRFQDALTTSCNAVNRIAESVRKASSDSVERFGRARMMALADMARLGVSAAPKVAELLQDGNAEVRAIACESLGFLGSNSVSRDLERVVATDPNSEARLYAARSLGQLGTIRPTPAILRARDEDVDGNVRLQVRLALSRPKSRDMKGIRESLAAFSGDQINSATVDQPAPEFHLRDMEGQTRSLSEYRGKSSVVLVFLVGDICPYCPGQINQLRSYKKRFENLGAVVVLVEAHEQFRLGRTLSGTAPHHHDSDILLLSDPSSTVSATYGTAMRGRGHTEWSNLPSTFVIDRSGIIRFVHRDPADSRVNPEDLIGVLGLINHLDGLSNPATGG